MLNSVERSNCARCGSPLLIVSAVRGQTLDPDELDGFEEHLLERVSALETELERARQQNEHLLDLLHRQATNSFNDHVLLDAVVNLLEERGGLPRGVVDVRWRELLDRYTEELDERERVEERSKQIVDAFAGDDLARFERQIEEGAQLMVDGDMRRGVRHFEKALLLDPKNGPLQFFLGEHFFFDGRRALARHYLELTLASDSGNSLAALMLGVVCGDEGEIAPARVYFERALELREDSFVAHYGLGRLYAIEKRFGDALRHFKRALRLAPSAEMHYLVGRAYIELKRFALAERHMRKAIDLDPSFDPALYHLGLIHISRSELERARDCFRAAVEANPNERRYRSALSAKSAKGLAALPLFGAARATRKQSITSGDSRFTMLLMQQLADDALGAPRARD
jgi:tetratricopeptide (TPR) repeat protein